MANLPHIAVCICTYRRPACLERLLDALATQETENLFTYSIVIADNDAARSAESIVEKFANSTSAVSFLDPPYNVKIDGHVSGNGKKKHREFVQASGEMSEAEFTGFLATFCGASLRKLSLIASLTMPPSRSEGAFALGAIRVPFRPRPGSVRRSGPD